MLTLITLGALAVIIRNIYKIKIAYDFSWKRLFINENAFTTANYTSTRNFEGLAVLKTPILELIIELLFQVPRKGSEGGGVGVGNLWGGCSTETSTALRYFEVVPVNIYTRSSDANAKGKQRHAGSPPAFERLLTSSVVSQHSKYKFEIFTG